MNNTALKAESKTCLRNRTKVESAVLKYYSVTKLMPTKTDIARMTDLSYGTVTRYFPSPAHVKATLPDQALMSKTDAFPSPVNSVVVRIMADMMRTALLAIRQAAEHFTADDAAKLLASSSSAPQLDEADKAFILAVTHELKSLAVN